MIDKKKIEEARDDIFEDVFFGNGEDIVFTDDEGNEDYEEEMYYGGQIKKAIELGAHWAIQAFLKELWHDAKKEPKENTDIIYINDEQEIDILKNYQGGHNWLYYGSIKGWAACKTICGIISWAYASDLLPKQKGGNKQ